MTFFPDNAYSADELAAEALEAACLQPCHRCQQLTPQQIRKVLHQLTPMAALVQAHCQGCKQNQWLMLAN
jgi:hypothetical protein